MITEDGVERVIPSGGVMITGWENPEGQLQIPPLHLCIVSNTLDLQFLFKPLCHADHHVIHKRAA
mgnify:CR=1 FL=1